MKKIRNIILLLGILALIVLGFIRYSSFFGVLYYINDFQDILVNQAEMNPWVARAISVPISAIYVYFGVIYLLSLKRKKIIIGSIVYLSGIVAFAILMFVVTKDYKFNEQGTPIKCEALNPNTGEYEIVDCKYNKHPIYGTEVKPVDWEIKHFVPTLETRCFSSNGKEALIWFYKYENGKVEFFEQPGHHPQFGYKLHPITTGIVKLMHSYLKDDPGMIIGTGQDAKFEIKERELIKKKANLDSINNVYKEKKQDSINNIINNKRYKNNKDTKIIKNKVSTSGYEEQKFVKFYLSYCAQYKSRSYHKKTKELIAPSYMQENKISDYAQSRGIPFKPLQSYEIIEYKNKGTYIMVKAKGKDVFIGYKKGRKNIHNIYSYYFEFKVVKENSKFYFMPNPNISSKYIFPWFYIEEKLTTEKHW